MFAQLYRFADFELEPDALRLRRGGRDVAISPLCFELLVYLIRARNRVMSHAELLAAGWPGTTVTHGSLRQAMRELRKAFGEGHTQELIKTFHGRGYRFVAKVWESPATPSESRPAQPGAQAEPALRARALAQLEGALLGSEKTGRACMITGEAGMGKSWLTQQIARNAERRGFTCLFAGAAQSASAPAFWPWIQLLQQLVELRAERARSVRSFPRLHRLLYHASTGEPSYASLRNGSGEERFALFCELERFIVASAAEVPLLVVMEDLHWADEASLAFLAHRAASFSKTPGLWLLTSRPHSQEESGAASSCFRELSLCAHLEQVQLDPLTLTETTELVRFASKDSIREGMSRDIQRVTAGNPLFVMELARHLPYAQQGPDLAAWTSSGVRMAIHNRLQRLPQRLLATLSAAAVLGVDFTLRDLAAALDDTVEATLQQLELGVNAGVLVRADAFRYRFAHPLLKETTYDSIERRALLSLHSRIAEQLEARDLDDSPARLARLAHHFFFAATPATARKAIHYAVLCARQCHRATAYADALLHCDHALSCSELVSDLRADELLELQLLHIEIRCALGHEAEPLRQQLVELCRRAETLADGQLYARCVLCLHGHQSARSPSPRLAMAMQAGDVESLERALRGLGPQAQELRVLLLCALVCALFWSVERERCQRLADEAVTMAAELREPYLEAHALLVRSYAAAGPEGHELRLSDTDRLVGLAHHHGLLDVEIEARMTRAMCRLELGTLAAAEDEVDHAQRLARSSENVRVKARCQLVTLMKAFWNGEWAEAERLSQKAFSAAANDPIDRSLLLLRLSMLQVCRTGRTGEGIDLYETLLGLYPSSVAFRCVLAHAYATAGRETSAVRHFDFVAADNFRLLPRNLCWLSEMVMLAGTAVAIDDPTRAKLVYAQLAPFGHLVDFYGVEACPAGSVAHWLAELATTMGELGRAQRWLAQAEVHNRGLESAYLTQQTALARARLLLEGRDDSHSAARELVASVLAFADRTGSAWLRQQASAISARLSPHCARELPRDRESIAS